jgi:hypothetical protein
MKNILTLIFLFVSFYAWAQPVLRYDENISVTYDEAIEAYSNLAEDYSEAHLFTEGLTDVGRPLHLFVISADEDFDPQSLRNKGKLILLINNGIHPGEPCGIDASIKFAHTVLSEKKYDKMLDKVVVAIIPVYNIGGTLNRNEYWRPQQPGPKELGFRGNARNLDLNRDFVKHDTRNAQSFSKIYHEWKPDVFLDTHTTNGSDHKHVITLISSNKDRFSTQALGDFVKNTFEQQLYSDMEKTDYNMIPYISWMHADPKEGIIEYFTNGNFSTGYTGMFNTISFMTENHVYKPFRDRVLSVYEFELSLLKTSRKYAKTIKKLRKEAEKAVQQQDEFVIERQLDTTRYDSFEYTGYEYLLSQSPLTGLMRKAYNRDSVFTADIPFYRYYQPKYTVKKPEMYIIPQAWREVIDALKRNEVNMFRLAKDAKLETEVYYINNNQKAERQYNGHIANVDFDLCTEMQEIQYYKGDYLVPVNQVSNNYIVEMLEPKGAASFFRWNFFDPILERREYMIPSGFEEAAMKYLEENPALRKTLEEKKQNDPEFAGDHYAQMWFIYTYSPYDEKSYLRYPAGRLMQVDDSLPIE